MDRVALELQIRSIKVLADTQAFSNWLKKNPTGSRVNVVIYKQEDKTHDDHNAVDNCWQANKIASVGVATGRETR